MAIMSDRGLASADEETKERVARKGGEARAKDPESLAEAGRKGGEAVVEKYGPEHMAEIGKKGGESISQDTEHMAEIGAKGGQASGGGSEGGNERGFAAMSEEERKRIASKGGQK